MNERRIIIIYSLGSCNSCLASFWTPFADKLRPGPNEFAHTYETQYKTFTIQTHSAKNSLNKTHFFPFLFLFLVNFKALLFFSPSKSPFISPRNQKQARYKIKTWCIYFYFSFFFHHFHVLAMPSLLLFWSLLLLLIQFLYVCWPTNTNKAEETNEKKTKYSWVLFSVCIRLYLIGIDHTHSIRPAQTRTYRSFDESSRYPMKSEFMEVVRLIEMKWYNFKFSIRQLKFRNLRIHRQTDPRVFSQ